MSLNLAAPKLFTRETVSFFQANGHTVRIWRGFKNNLEAYNPHETNETALYLLKDWMDKGRTIQRIAEEICSWPDVNAVEIRDLQDQGIVIYADWP